MNYGGDAADQIVRYSLDGVDHGLRLSGTLAKHLAVFVAAVLKDQKKTRGKTRMVRMLKENKPLKFFTVPSDRLREFCSEGRKRGLLYVIIRDKKNPEMSEVMVFADDADRKMFRYKAFYSLDCNDGIENAAIGWAQPSPEDYLIEKEELAEYEELIRRLYEAISFLPPMQARRVHARYMLGMKVKDIAAMEGITPSQAGKSIHAALRRLRRYFARQKWTVNL